MNQYALSKYSLISLCLISLFLLSCEADSVHQPESHEAGSDQMIEGGALGGVVVEAGVEVAKEAGAEAGVEAGIEAGFESGIEAGIEAGVESGIEAGIEAGVEAGIEAGAEPLECVVGEMRVGETPCGVDERGRLEQSCVEGAWSDTDICRDNELNEELINQLTQHLATASEQRVPFTELTFAQTPLNQVTATEVERLLWDDHLTQVMMSEREDHIRGEIIADNTTMRYLCFTHGARPEAGWTLYISMHGGGGAPPEVNDQQWVNQQRLYDSTGRIQEGLYCAPRAPTDTWNMWHRAHIDALFTALIRRLIVLENVNPNRVILMGYSAGGDGVYQLAPRMADQIAAAAMSAGHPNNAQPYGLRNIGFTIHMGGQDTAYNRAGVAAEWAMRLSELQSADDGPGSPYEHAVHIHEGIGHWMSLRDAIAFDFMRPFVRSVTPAVIKWHQSSVTHERFYWLWSHAPNEGDRVSAIQEGQRFTIAPEQTAELSLWLRDDQVDLDREIEVYTGRGELLYRGVVARTASAIYQSLTYRGDPAAVVHAQLRLPSIEP